MKTIKLMLIAVSLSLLIVGCRNVPIFEPPSTSTTPSVEGSYTVRLTDRNTKLNNCVEWIADYYPRNINGTVVDQRLVAVIAPKQVTSVKVSGFNTDTEYTFVKQTFRDEGKCNGKFNIAHVFIYDDTMAIGVDIEIVE